jgi:alpha-L-fucosidase
MLAPALLALAMTVPPTVVPPPDPLPPVPSARQLAWHELEYCAFVHFNMNTFTDREWGTGDEDPALFDPSALDCRQWARVCRDAGMQGIIITAKHHDGFCLWPSASTDHTVAASPWRDGKGDLLRELSDACAEFGLRFGVYLSPWDRNQPSYGDSPRYNAFFVDQLEEVLTSYGPVFEVWFDGACGEGPNGKRQEYDWDAYVATVRRLQPDAVIFSDAGPDVRWVGNERGHADATNWSLLRRDEFEPGTPRYRELTQGHADGTHWLPAECNTSIRPGWYYHRRQDDAVKTLDELEDIWERSVGMNGGFLLNLPVDRRGLVHERDAERLMELRALLDATYADDLARGATATATNVRGDDPAYAAAAVTDGDPSTYWATDDGVTSAQLEIDLGSATALNRVVLAEPIALGQRVESFAVHYRDGGAWVPLAEGTTIGRKRILRTPGIVTNRLRLTIESARACPLIATVAVHAAPPRVTIAAPQTSFVGATRARLTADFPDAAIYYTLGGRRPTRAAERYTGPIAITRTTTLKAIAVVDDRESFEPARQAFTRYGPEDLRAPVHFIRPPDPGLRYVAFEGTWQSLDDIGNRAAAGNGLVGGIDLTVRPRDEHFALFFSGFVKVPADGIYTFTLASDDGSRLQMGGDVIVDNDGLHGMREAQGVVGLQAGYHPIMIQWFNATGGLGLEVSIAGPGIEEQPLPSGMLFR